jgi:hypothetical protein
MQGVKELVTIIGSTDAGLMAQVRAILADNATDPEPVVLSIDGYGGDPQEIGRSSEVIAHCGRLVDLGIISILVDSTWSHEMDGTVLLGGLEVWMGSQNHLIWDNIWDPTDATMALIEQFDEEVLPAAGRVLEENLQKYADVLAGEPVGRFVTLGVDSVNLN